MYVLLSFFIAHGCLPGDAMQLVIMKQVTVQGAHARSTSSTCNAASQSHSNTCTDNTLPWLQLKHVLHLAQTCKHDPTLLMLAVTVSPLFSGHRHSLHHCRGLNSNFCNNFVFLGEVRVHVGIQLGLHGVGSLACLVPVCNRRRLFL